MSEPTDEQVDAYRRTYDRARRAGDPTRSTSTSTEAEARDRAAVRAGLAAARAAGPVVPRPSQGQSIPVDQLAAYVRWADREAGLSNDDPVEQVAKAAYAVGFAAALGHRITVSSEGFGVHIGDRVDIPPEADRP